MTPQGIGGLDAGDVSFLRPALGGASQQEILRTIDIFNDYFQKANIPPDQGEKLVQTAISGGSKFEREGNTVMAFKQLSVDAAQVYFFSVDRPEAFAQSMVRLIAPLKESGVQVLYMNKVDPTIVKTMQDVGIQTQQSDRPEYKVMAAI